jgi:hypothetical protein
VKHLSDRDGGEAGECAPIGRGSYDVALYAGMLSAPFHSHVRFADTLLVRANEFSIFLLCIFVMLTVICDSHCRPSISRPPSGRMH